MANDNKKKNQLKDYKEDFPGWYNDVVLKAELADYSPVKGCMVIRPYGYALWESIQAFLDKLIKDKGVKNAYFPLFIPKHFLNKEKEHVKGFAPELAVVTIGGGEELGEELVVRPTSETIMYDMYRKWTSSWRDLPILINQWCNVVRWEKRTYMFLRTTEFLWQEGHCAHLTHEENMEMVLWAIQAYEKTYKELMGIYGIIGTKSNTEKFAGAKVTYTFESLMPNGKSLQSCTSHDLGQNFSKSFEWTVQGKNSEKVYPWQNSWGFSTRSIGGLIMSHGDAKGLVLPPNIAPIQIIIIPIPDHEKGKEFANNLFDKLKTEFRVQIDDLPDETAGFKFNKWELKGVPLRIEIGNKEAENQELTLYRRDTGEKQKVKAENISDTLKMMLKKIQEEMYEKHKKFTEDNTFIVDSYEKFKEIMLSSKGFIKAFWCEDSECEENIKTETKATTRCLPINSQKEKGKCVHCGKDSSYRWVFGQSY